MSGEKRTWYIICGASLILMFAFLALFVRFRGTFLLLIGLVMLNIAYQSIVRLLVNTICEGAFENGINSSSDWFKTTSSEARFYEFMGIKYLKKSLPKLERSNFSLARQSIQEIIDRGCEIEAEREFTLLASMLCPLLIIPFGYAWLFLIFAVAAIAFDLVYIAVQRYNRPRLERTQIMRRARFFEKMEKEETENNSEDMPSEHIEEDKND